MLTLVVFAPNGARRIPLTSRPLTIGSDPSSDVMIEGRGVAPVHVTLYREMAEARVRYEVESDLRVEVNGVRRGEGHLELLDELRIADHCLLLDDPVEVGEAAVDSVVVDAARSEERSAASPARFLERISAMTRWVAADSSSDTSAESLLVRLLEDLGGGAVFLFEGQLVKDCGVRFTVSHGEGWTDRAEDVLRVLVEEVHPDRLHSFGEHRTTIGGQDVRVLYRLLDALERQYCVAAVTPWGDLDGWNPAFGFSAVADLLVLGLVHHVGRYEPILPGRGRERKLVLAPGLVLGSSTASTRLAAQISRADDSSNVLLHGPVGSGRELVARSLHLSSRRKEGPFVRFDCEQPNERVLLADLVGAQIEGRRGPVRREGKLYTATGGTIYLDGLEHLPLSAQAVLVNVLRSQALEGPGELERSPFDARVVSSTGVSLDELCDRAEFRRDLLVRLAEFRIEVPGLSERREDLPLLIQTMVNRFSHEVGKRVRGITVRALALISSHHFAGNLRELENVVRHMVYLAESESPMDVACLPEHIRNQASSSSLREPGGGAPGEGLVALLNRVERSAVRSALEESRGNKALAARRLGISRSALARRIERHQL